MSSIFQSLVTMYLPFEDILRPRRIKYIHLCPDQCTMQLSYALDNIPRA